LGLDSQAYVATIDAGGEIRLPYLGVHEAAGKTLDELSQAIVLANAGRQIRQALGGVDAFILLDESDLFLDMETYRPVTVTGLVASPGRVVFEPGMSARTAIGSAGGVAFQGDWDRADQLASWRTRQAELRQTEVWLLADLWRITALLEGEESDAPSKAVPDTLTKRLSASGMDMVRSQIRNARDQLERQRDDIEARIVLTQQRIEFLKTAMSQYKTASDIEEERLQNMLQLSASGLATVNTLDNAREGALNASSRLLTTQADMAAAERDLQSLSLAMRGLYEDFEARLLDERVRTERNLAETRARLSGLSQELALGMIATEDSAPGSLRIILHRRVDGEETSREIEQDVLLNPGDVVEVFFIDE
jgi:protein involved in polysaccharide export with SLBB domain